MSFLKKTLLAGAAGLALSFGAAAAQKDEKPVTVGDIAAQYKTKASKALAGIETALNAGKPAGTPQVVFTDIDQLSTWLQATGDLNGFYPAVVDYIGAKTRRDVDPETALEAAKALFELRGNLGFHPQLQNQALSGKALEESACIVIPHIPGQTVAGHFNLRLVIQNGAATGINVSGDVFDAGLTNAELENIMNAAEGFRCLDTRYTKNFNTAANILERAVFMHQSQVFSDLGGVMMAVRQGGAPALADKLAHFRAAEITLTEESRVLLLDARNPNYAASTTLYTIPALQELQARIEKMGVEAFRKLPVSELVEMAHDITGKKSLDMAEIGHALGYMELGQAHFEQLARGGFPAAQIAQGRNFVTRRLKTLSDMTEKAMRAPTEAEKASVPQLTAEMLGIVIDQHIEQHADVKKSPNSLAALLKARAELTDKMRDLLQTDPSTAAFTNQVLRAVFTSDPLLRQHRAQKEKGVTRVKLTIA